MIGALADWFAVVALFRHPWACRFPTPPSCRATRRGWPTTCALHPRPLPRHRLAGGALQAADPPSRIAELAAAARQRPALADRAGVVLVQSLDFMDDRRVRRLLVHAPASAPPGSTWPARWGGHPRRLLTENRRHQGLLDEGIRKLAAWLDEPGVQAALAA